MKKEKRHQELQKASQAALAEAGRDAIGRGKQAETPVWIWKDEHWVDVLADPLYPSEADERLSLARVREESKDQ